MRPTAATRSSRQEYPLRSTHQPLWLMITMKKLTVLFSFLLIGLLLNGQSLKRLKNGVLIKENQYLENEYKVEFQVFDVGSVTVEIAQIFRKEFDRNDFNCKAIIQTKEKGKILDELYYENIEAVGSSYGICFNEKQPDENFLIGSKYGDYAGQLIIIDNRGRIIKKPGGDYFTSTNKKHLISDWYSDLSGITIFDFETGETVYSNELPVFLSKWYENTGKYYAAEWEGNRETNNIYEFNLDNLSLVKTDLDLEKLHQFEEVNLTGCKPN